LWCNFYYYKLVPIYGHFMMCHCPVLQSLGKYGGPDLTSFQENLMDIRVLPQQKQNRQFKFLRKLHLVLVKKNSCCLQAAIAIEMPMHTRLLNELQIKVKTLNSYFVCSRAGCASNNKEPQKVFPTSAQPCYF